MPTPIHNVPTNIISGFLGVGKTTAILNLFSQKPADEKWAVLVNEFGKVGIDGKVYQASGIAVKEIPGGCMCCAQGLPLQVAVNRLLAETKPQRLIIESSGIGHPGGVLKTLTGDGFSDVLEMKAGICLFDPMHLIDPAYQGNELFKEQLQLADVLVANKTDLASDEALQAIKHLSDSFTPVKALLTSTRNAALEMSWLDMMHTKREQQSVFKLFSNKRVTSTDQNWQSHSVSFADNEFIDLVALKTILDEHRFVRAKGLLQAEDGCYLINYSNGRFDAVKTENSDGNHLEVIAEAIDVLRLEQDLSRIF